MKITKHQLKRIIRESFITELRMTGTTGMPLGSARGSGTKKGDSEPLGPHGANISDIVRAKPTIKDWADLLLDELEDEVSQISNIPDQKRDKVTDELTIGVVTSLGKALGYWAPRRSIK